MWHCVKPPACGRYLCPPEVVRRLKREFAYVETSEEGGRRHVFEVMQLLLTLRQTGGVQVDDECIVRLERVQERAICVCFGDDLASETSLLNTPVVPEEPLIFEYLSAEHQRSLEPLVARCAAVLGYEMVAAAQS
jgi:hypothetical protein